MLVVDAAVQVKLPLYGSLLVTKILCSQVSGPTVVISATVP